MSAVDRALPDQLARTVTDSTDSLLRAGSTLTDSCVTTVRAVAFWLATLLPLSYLPLLAMGVAAEHPSGFVALLCSNAVAFVLGHTHEPRTAGAER